MKTTNAIFLVIILFVCPIMITAQQNEIIPNLKEMSTLYNTFHIPNIHGTN